MCSLRLLNSCVPASVIILSVNFLFRAHIISSITPVVSIMKPRYVAGGMYRILYISEGSMDSDMRIMPAIIKSMLAMRSFVRGCFNSSRAFIAFSSTEYMCLGL